MNAPRRRSLLPALFAALAAASLLPSPARAGAPEDLFAFKNKRGQSLHFVVLDDGGRRAASLIVAPSDDAPPEKRLSIDFLSAQEWAKFAALWKKARRAAPPKADKPAPAGSYRAPDGGPRVDMNVGRTGDILLLFFGGKDDPSHYGFQTGGSGRDEVGAAVDKVTAFFARP